MRSAELVAIACRSSSRAGVELRTLLAIAIVGGLLATVLTLFVVPVLYRLVARV